MPSIRSLPWPEFLDALKELSEEECWTQLILEKQDRNRTGYIQRLYGRANLLRSQRERREWLGD